MSSTLATQSFSEINLGERTSLKLAANKNDASLQVESSAGFEIGKTIYVGALSREGCEKAVVSDLPDSTTITLAAPLKYEHPAFDQVTAVLGDLIRVWRAPNLDGQVPALDAFSIYATRSINPENALTFYTDSTGSSQWWYRATYFNASTMEGTDLDASVPVRGDDFGHYASLSSIRREAGFEGAVNLSDVDVDQQRRAAESEINSTLGSVLTVPFVKPIPEAIVTVTIQLAAGLLLQQFYGDQGRGKTLVTSAREKLANLRSGSADTGDVNNAVASGVSGYPDGSDDTPRMFSVGDIY